MHACEQSLRCGASWIDTVNGLRPSASGGPSIRATNARMVAAKVRLHQSCTNIDTRRLASHAFFSR